MGDTSGHGIIEFYCLGPYEPYDFEDATGVARPGLPQIGTDETQMERLT
jgi:hypothetical protein